MSLVALLLVVGALAIGQFTSSVEYSAAVEQSQVPLPAPEPPKPVVTHLPTPVPVKAIYMTSWVAGTTNFRNDLVKLLDEKEVNALVIDVKDYTGKISFPVTDPKLQAIGSAEERVEDMKEFIAELHEKGIYVIARIAVFQDPFLTAKRPDLAVKKADGVTVWQDFKGAKWLDSASPEAWDYVVAIGREAYAAGFDELNFDYIRFPSDGNMKDISYPFFGPKKITKHESMAQFFAYLKKEFAEPKVPISADIFGMVTTNPDDLNIGQLLEDAAANFDYIAPMVYPSHYPTTFMGFKNPADHPYEIIKHSMDEAAKRLQAINIPINKLRPWLQDFNLGAVYTPELIRQEKQAVYDAGLDSWMMWAPSNRYTAGALD
jgi:hypothetical protein